MAAEMSCLTGVDEDDKDADPEINALKLLQEPVRMAQDSACCTDSFGKPSLKQNSVLDVLSNTDMLSPVGLGNGPSLHQATQAHELNNISTDKEEVKSITPLKTVQEIDTAGIWGFDDSPENSLDNFTGAGDLHWDPHKEFMQFLWENHGDSPGEEPKDEASSANSQRRRKRKMDMVVMVDPSEDLYPDLSHKSSEELSDAEDQADSIPVRKVRKSRNFSQSQSPPTGKVPTYPNGTVKAIKDILHNAPPRNSHENSIGHGLSPLKGRLSMNSHSEEKPSCYPGSKCKLIFNKEHHLHRHMKSHVDSPNISPEPFICRECGQTFRQSVSLIEHMSIHKEKTARLTEEIKGVNDKKKEDKKKLFCPQCTFVTNCPNTFVQHAKTHEKDERKFRCDKCSFRTLSETEFRRHDKMPHITVRKKIQNNDSELFSCKICSYRAFNKSVFKNHLLRRHQQTLEEKEVEQLIEKIEQPSKEQHVPTTKTPVEDAEITSKLSIKNPIPSKRACSPSDSSDISDLFKNSKINRGLKTPLTESKLDKSINVLLSRQRNGKKTPEQRKESDNLRTSVPDAKGDIDSDQLPRTLTIKVEDSDSTQNGHWLTPNAAKIDQSTVRKSPSKRKMSTPYRNTSEQDSCFILPKPLLSPMTMNQEEDDEEEEEEEESYCKEKDIFQFSDTDTDADTDLFDNGIKKEKQNIIYTYSRRMSMRGALQASKRLFEKIKTEEQDQTIPEIKEECIETEVFQETIDSHQIPLSEDFTGDFDLELESDRKNCPYCPAVFESGVGLSNHVRGHLHRVGLSYNARHAVSPEQVASQDRRPRIRSKISAFQRLKKALQLESEPETVKSIHSCPLCGDSFDNRTGQSNHIRGHLKKLGKSIATKNKSPLFLLRELMRDKKEFQRALQILGKRRNHFQDCASPKVSNVDSFTPAAIGFPKSDYFPSACADAQPLMPTFSFMEMESEKKQPETKFDVKNSLTETTALIGILKKRKCQEDGRIKGSSHMSRNLFAVSSDCEHSSGSRVASSLPNSLCV
ncbi:zinc finger protein 644a isoform X2 [Pseudoliparis swirei]|uniref:zinc finger protein 644a isoform X2 n=1 Tax=Pseudoliparis swirei TaxID=2059687 RepID=UPI0024BD6CE9|nr:zinc finger protein 644a isoform X2 [Pseudoliparis swirei]